MSEVETAYFSLEDIDTLAAALRPPFEAAGYAVVPIKPTAAMIKAGSWEGDFGGAYCVTEGMAEAVYEAMVTEGMAEKVYEAMVKATRQSD